MNKLKFIVSILALFCFESIALASGGGADVHWGYEGAMGPAYWGGMSESYKLCSKGKNQSPVNIDWSADLDLDPIQFHYNQSPVSLINNGHSIQLNYAPGSYIEIAGDRFELLQLHFHYLSEHQVHGKHFPMEMHLVHKSKDNRLAVVGVFLNQGQSNATLQKLWDKLPEKGGQTYSGNDVVNASALLPDTNAYYHYMGSLTTPPCSEGVRWLVLKQPVEISENQIATFKKMFPNNFRPAMPLNKRNMFATN